MPNNYMPTATPSSLCQNHLLAALPAGILARLSPHLELIAMPLGEVLYESGGQLQHAYFPTTVILSLHYVMEDGASAEIAGVGLPLKSVGNDGGIQPFRGTPCWRAAKIIAALYPGVNYSDSANGGLQPASFGRTAIVSLAAADSRSFIHE